VKAVSVCERERKDAESLDLEIFEKILYLCFF